MAERENETAWTVSTFKFWILQETNKNKKKTLICILTMKQKQHSMWKAEEESIWFDLWQLSQEVVQD